MPWTSQHVCDQCRKVFITDNAWIWCDGPELTVKARFCCEACRTKFLVARGWQYDALMRLRPPEDVLVDSL